ncbi:MAG TPA: dihydrolipoyl dehydrogenase [Longimicrobiaceae bacterium]|nr:dihydrolipoyl dehydrogenase [Longimicrobiaceae bacterium]
MADSNFDIVVIGAGPGGYVAAIRAAQLGYNTACVEEGNLGGVCLNIGCIPTKALLESAAMITHLGHAKDFGVTVGEIKTDLAQAVKRSRQVSERLVKGIGFLFKKNKVTHLQGRGRLAGKGKVEVTGKDGKTQTVTAKHVIIATGSRPRDLPFLKIDHDRVWDSTDAMMAQQPPKTLAIVGAGAIGCEFADVYAAFGTQVTIIEVADRILPLEDRDCSAVVEKSYRKRGMTVLTGTKLEKADIGKDGVKLTVKTPKGETQVIEAERVLSAIGRAPLVEDIGLEQAGVKLERGFIAIDRQMKTNVEGIYAIGDVAGPPLLAHKGSHEGVQCVEAIHGDAHAGIDYGNIPNCTYCHPEVASVGLTEEQAREQGFDIEVGTFPWTANGRALTAGETDGFVKIIRDKKYSEVLGAHIVGPHATELIAEFVVGRHLETTAEEMDRAIHPHPTLSEAVAEAALASLGHALHI